MIVKSTIGPYVLFEKPKNGLRWMFAGVEQGGINHSMSILYSKDHNLIELAYTKGPTDNPLRINLPIDDGTKNMLEEGDNAHMLLLHLLTGAIDSHTLPNSMSEGVMKLLLSMPIEGTEGLHFQRTMINDFIEDNADAKIN